MDRVLNEQQAACSESVTLDFCENSSELDARNVLADRDLSKAYQNAFDKAKELLEQAKVIPRYDIDIPPHWQKSPTAQAIEQGHEHLVQSKITLKGKLVEATNQYRGPNFHFRDKGSGVGHAPRRRGPCRGYSADSNMRLRKRVEEVLPNPDVLSGRLVMVTASPLMTRSQSSIRNQKAAFETHFSQVAKRHGIYAITRMGFSPRTGNTKPHFHAIVILPSTRSREACRLMSDGLRREIDKGWRKINGNGLQATEGWKLKTDDRAVKNAIRYFKHHETHPNAQDCYERPWHEHGVLPEVHTDEWSVTPEQGKRVWAAICARHKKAEHPLGCNFRLSGVDPKLILMLLLHTGVTITIEQLERYTDSS